MQLLISVGSSLEYSSTSMPPAPKTTFLVFFAAELEAPLPSGDAAISAALDAYGAKYSKGSSKKLKDLREETLAGLSWRHMNH